MICPQCRAEYRQGFTVCADCDVPLVPQYETGTALAAPEPAAAPGDPNEDPFCSLWKGDDARLHAEMCSILDSVGIPHKTVRRHDHLFNLNNYPAFQIGVPFSLYERAELAIKEAFDIGGENTEDLQLMILAPPVPDGSERIRKLPAMLSPPANEAIPGPASAGRDADWFPEDATVAVWSGDDESLQEMLIASLNENRIQCRWEKRADKFTLFVQPADESRAREIIQEIIEAAPPS